jgi:hypothetical protein
MPRPLDPAYFPFPSNVGSMFAGWRAPLGLFSLFHIMRAYFCWSSSSLILAGMRCRRSFLCGSRDRSSLISFQKHILWPDIRRVYLSVPCTYCSRVFVNRGCVSEGMGGRLCKQIADAGDILPMQGRVNQGRRRLFGLLYEGNE